MTESGRPTQAGTPMLDASEGDPPRDVLGADLDDSGTDLRPGPKGRADGDEDDVARAPAGPDDAPVDPQRPVNPA